MTHIICRDQGPTRPPFYIRPFGKPASKADRPGQLFESPIEYFLKTGTMLLTI